MFFKNIVKVKKKQVVEIKNAHSIRRKYKQLGRKNLNFNIT